MKLPTYTGPLEEVVENLDTALSDLTQKFRQHLTNSMKLNKIDEVWNSANLLLK